MNKENVTIFVLKDFLLRLEAEPPRTIRADRVTPMVLQTHRIEPCRWDGVKSWRKFLRKSDA